MRRKHVLALRYRATPPLIFLQLQMLLPGQRLNLDLEASSEQVLSGVIRNAAALKTIIRAENVHSS